MVDPQRQSTQLTEFELICARLEDYEHLPELVPGAVNRRHTGEPVDRRHAIGRVEHEETLDAEILAGLVQP